MIFIGKISKGHNSVKNVYGIRVLFFFSFWKMLEIWECSIA